MQVQMRRYRIKEGAEEAFLKVFREVILPLRKEMGFRVLGAYLLPERGFLWFVAHENFQEAEKAYYTHPKRQEVDPSLYLEEVQTQFVEALEV